VTSIGKSAYIANNLDIGTEYGIMFGLERVNKLIAFQKNKSSQT